MTEMVNGDAQNLSNSSAEVPVTPSSTVSSSSHEERTFRQSEVNDLIGRAKSEAVERYKRDASIASREHQQPVRAESQFHGMSEQEFRRIAAEESQKQRDEWLQQAERNAQEQDAQRVANEFLNKIEAGKSKYQDFDKKIQDVGFGYFPHVVQLANMVDNTDDVVYELANNPTKIANIQNLVDMALRTGAPPTLAINEMRRLSNSIKENQKAANFKSPNEPLSQMRPSNAGTDNGVRTASDYKRNPLYKV